ncbi:MAG: mRNA-degrading endonuclease [Thermodesulfovibrio sp.]|nr:mRNA-degrading endonuclease [Thermodesulfovibrio sp.]
MVKEKIFIPTRGHIVWLDFDPQVGHEQAGRRPALVISPAAYNGKIGLALMCPITGQVKGYPFEVVIPQGLDVSGVILSDQIKSLDWRSRNAEFCCNAPHEVVSLVLEKLDTLLS